MQDHGSNSLIRESQHSNWNRFEATRYLLPLLRPTHLACTLTHHVALSTVTPPSQSRRPVTQPKTGPYPCLVGTAERTFCRPDPGPRMHPATVASPMRVPTSAALSCTFWDQISMRSSNASVSLMRSIGTPRHRLTEGGVYRSVFFVHPGAKVARSCGIFSFGQHTHKSVLLECNIQSRRAKWCFVGG